jgi:hypothetical protein
LWNQWEAERFVSNYDFDDESNDHRKPVLLLEERRGSGYHGTVAGRGET